MRKNPHDRILKGEPKEQHLNTVPKSCSMFIYHIVNNIRLTQNLTCALRA